MIAAILAGNGMITPIEWAIFAVLTLGTGLGSAYVVYLVIKPRLQATVRGYLPAITKSIKRSMAETVAETLEGVDLGEIAGQIGGEGGGLGDIAGLLGGKGGGLGDLLKLFSQFAGKGKEGGGSSGW